MHPPGALRCVRPRWFVEQTHLLDEDVSGQVDTALRKVGRNAPDGKVVAQLMLGTWVALLGRGGSRADGTRARYVADLWGSAISAAFPASSRGDVHRLAMRLNWARNRINHCEPVVFGFPQPGLGRPGVQVRRSPVRVLEDARILTTLVDARLGRVSQRLARCGTIEACSASRIFEVA